MSYLRKQDVEATIKARVLGPDGAQYTIYEAYFGTNPYTKKPVRKAANTETKLKKKIADFFKKLSSGGDAAVLLTPFESIDARNALDLLKSRNSKLTLTECVRAFLDGTNSVKSTCSTTLAEAYAKYLTAQEGKSDGHIKAVRARVGAWVTLFGGDRLISDVSAKEVNEGLESRLYDPKRIETKTTYNNHLSYIKTFIAWCAEPEQSYIAKSPIEGMKLKVKEWREPVYMKADDVSKLFTDLWEHRDESPADLAYAVLSFFCGMRQEEIQRVRLGPAAVNINIDERFIRVIKCKGSTKGVKPRCFTIPDTAMAWMRSFDFMKSVMLTNNQFRRHLNWAAERAKITVPANAGRHTFITMYSAAYKNQIELTKIVGNSEEVRGSNYDGVGNEKEGLRYFSILPPTTTVDHESSEPLSR